MNASEARPGSPFTHWLGKLFLKLTGWRVSGEVPANGKLVIIAAPHTSNWDFVYLLAAAFELRLKIHWLGKASLFRPPFGTILKALGGIPVNRSHATQLVQQLTDRFANASRLAVVIPPSGSRSRTKYWKSGFYWTANNARATVVCGFLDYHRKVAGLGYSFVPTGAVAQDMDPVRAFYEGIQGKYPDQASAIRLKEEDLYGPADAA